MPSTRRTRVPRSTSAPTDDTDRGQGGAASAYHRRVTRRAAVLVLAVIAIVGTTATPAAAVEPDEVGTFPVWQLGGASGSFTATATFPVSSGIAAVSLASDASTLTGPSGVTGFLGASTAFGQEFGSTRSQPYLNIGTRPAGAYSTTTLTFTGPQPDGWGFAFGDVDADWVFIRAWTDAARADPLDVAELGFQSAGNYCTNAPKPGSCGAAPYTDAPVWVTAPETFDTISYLPGTLRGNSLPGAPAATRDTSGAYGWFLPTVDIAVMEVLVGPRDGIPTVQLWLAAPAPKATITGTISVPGETTVPDGTVVQLNNADGSPVLNAEELPVTTPVAPDGSFIFETEQRPADDPYQLVVIPPDGYSAPEPVLVIADVATPAAVAIVMPAVQPELAASGAEQGPLPLAALVVVLAGAFLVARGRVRPTKATAVRRRDLGPQDPVARRNT